MLRQHVDSTGQRPAPLSQSPPLDVGGRFPRRPRFFTGREDNDSENDMEMVLLIFMAAGALSYIQRERERMLQRARVKSEPETRRVRVIRH